MLGVRLFPTTTARRRLFQDDRQSNNASATAMEVEQKLLAQKQEQWSFDFINDVPVEGIWQWNIVIATENDDCRSSIRVW